MTNDKFSELPNYFLEEETIFHYTNYLSASLIISSKKLRFSHRKKSKDPIENLKIITNTISFSSSDEETSQIDLSTDSIVSSIEEKINEIENYTKQICFCKNDLINNDLGFLKPRMWNQYADDYKGVCLVFSKQQLLDEDSGNFIFSDIEYLDYQKLRSDFCINKNLIINKGELKFLEEFDDKIKKKLFQKHIDYRGENEFRITINSKNNLTELNIKKSLLGVILSVVNIDEERSKILLLKNLSKINNIDFNMIIWKNDGFEIIKYPSNYKIKL